MAARAVCFSTCNFAKGKNLQAHVFPPGYDGRIDDLAAAGKWGARLLLGSV